MSISAVKEYLALTDRISLLDDEIKFLKETRNTVEEQVLEEFAKHNIQNMNVDGRLVFVSRLLVASITGDTSEAINQFRAVGLADLIKERIEIHPQTLARWVRDLEDEGKPIPEGVRPFVKVFEKFNLRVRKG